MNIIYKSKVLIVQLFNANKLKKFAYIYNLHGLHYTYTCTCITNPTTKMLCYFKKFPQNGSLDMKTVNLYTCSFLSYM